MGLNEIFRILKSTLSTQTSKALQFTLRCHAALTEDLTPKEGFESDPIERRYGKYRRMSGGRFLVSGKDVKLSDKIIKMESLLTEGIDIDENLEVNQTWGEERKISCCCCWLAERGEMPPGPCVR